MPKISFPTIDLIRDYFDDSQIVDFLKIDGCINGEIELYSRECKGRSWYKDIECDVSKTMYKMMKGKNPKYMGIDIPVLISKPGNKETVMFIARDPQRNNAQVCCNDSPEKKIFIGTPFGVDIQECSNLYKNYINQILNSGFNLYISDVYKFFTNQGSGSDFNEYDFNEIPNNPLDLLLKEFDYIKDRFNCKKIICIHSDSKEVVKKYLFQPVMADVLEGPHPIGSRFWNAEKKARIPEDTLKIITNPEIKNYLIHSKRIKPLCVNSKQDKEIHKIILSADKRNSIRQKLISEGLITTKYDESVYINSILDKTDQKDSVIKYTFENDKLGINVYWNRAETAHNTDIMWKILNLKGTAQSDKTKNSSSPKATTQCLICDYNNTPDEIVAKVKNFESNLKNLFSDL